MAAIRPQSYGIVDDRREEVGGDDDGEVVAQAVDRGVVSGVEADEQVGVGRGVARPWTRPRTVRRSAGESLQAQPAPWEKRVRRIGSSVVVTTPRLRLGSFRASVTARSQLILTSAP